MISERPTLLDYIVFFETEPEWVHADGWYYGARFATQRADDRIVATIAPDDGEFSLEWWQGEMLRSRLQLVRASDWAIVTADSRELLRVTFDLEHGHVCELQLKPHVQVNWLMSW